MPVGPYHAQTRLIGPQPVVKLPLRIEQNLSR